LFLFSISYSDLVFQSFHSLKLLNIQHFRRIRYINFNFLIKISTVALSLLKKIFKCMISFSRLTFEFEILVIFPPQSSFLFQERLNNLKISIIRKICQKYIELKLTSVSLTTNFVVFLFDVEFSSVFPARCYCLLKKKVKK
jgi:hypothetical protein